MRLIEIRHGRSWYRYLTSVLDPSVLPPYVVGDLYSRRWRIEESFLWLKRLLGLSYLWTGEPLRWAGSPTRSKWRSINGIKLQIWATCGATHSKQSLQSPAEQDDGTGDIKAAGNPQPRALTNSIESNKSELLMDKINEVSVR